MSQLAVRSFHATSSKHEILTDLDLAFRGKTVVGVERKAVLIRNDLGKGSQGRGFLLAGLSQTYLALEEHLFVFLLCSRS